MFNNDKNNFNFVPNKSIVNNEIKKNSSHMTGREGGLENKNKFEDRDEWKKNKKIKDSDKAKWQKEIDKFDNKVNQCRNLNKIKNVEIEIKSDKDKDKPYVTEVKDWISKQRINWLNMNILTWNMQSFNKIDEEAIKKKSFLLENIAKINPEIIFLIDVGQKVNQLNIPNYRCANNGRDMLGIRYDIKVEPIIEQETFQLKQIDLNFVYIRPQEKNKEKIRFVKELMENNKAIIGDLNIKSNNFDLKNYDRIIGEPTLQTVYLKKKDYKSKIITNLAPSDHLLVVFEIKRRVPHTSQIRLESITYNMTKKVIKDIFSKGKTEYKIKISQVKKILPYNEENRLLNNILNEFMNHNTKSIFKKYDFLWKGFKKEPFLGTYIPQEVFDSLKEHYHNNDDKRYNDFDYTNIDNLEITELCPCYTTASNANTYDGYILSNIDKAINNTWNKMISNEECNIKNFVDFCNKTKYQMAFETFFLRKNKTLNSVNDIRIISIVPIQLKIWENLIYNSVLNYLTNYIDEKGLYQNGGRRGGSTYQAVFEVRTKFEEQDGKGILLLDLTKGYDSVIWEILENDINNIKDDKVRSMLKLWINLVCHTDCVANGLKIKKTRGLGMGLSLAPIIFEFYVHGALLNTRVNWKKIVFYVDDCALIISNLEDIDIFKNISSEFGKRGLMFNHKKSCILSADSTIIEKFKELEIKKKEYEKYLGISLGINNNNEVIVDDRYMKLSNSFTCIPKLICLSIKTRILDAAILARTRFSAMMISIKNSIELQYILRWIWKIYKRDFFKLSYSQLIFFMPNVAKYCFDLHDLMVIKQKTQNIGNLDEYENTINVFIKSRLTTKIPQWDKIINECWFNIKEDFEISLNGLKYWCKEVWKCIIKNNVNIWLREKRADGIKIKSSFKDLINTKLFKNFKYIQIIILKHFDEKRIDFFYFLINFFINIKKKLTICQKLFTDFKECNLPFVTDNNKEFRNILFNEYYTVLQTIIYEMLEYERKDKDKWKEILAISLVVDEICCNTRSYNKTVSELIYILNLKIKLRNNYIDKEVSIIMNEEDDEDYIVIEYSPENWDYTIAVDGSFANNKCGGGLIVRRKINGEFKDVDKLFFSVTNNNTNFRNVIGELKSTYAAISYAIENAWPELNILFDYMGVCKFSVGKWISIDKCIADYRKAINKLLRNSKLVINWYKIKSHTNVRLNDEADYLAKIGAKVLESRSEDKEIQEPIW